MFIKDYISKDYPAFSRKDSIEDASEVDLGVDAEAGAHGLRDAFRIDDRQHARHRGVDQRHVAVGLGAELSGSTREQLRLGSHLSVHLEADDDLPLAGGALDQIPGLAGLGRIGGGVVHGDAPRERPRYRRAPR